MILIVDFAYATRSALFGSSCVLGLAVNGPSCFAGGKASALSYTILGLAKTITVISIGVRFFDGVPTRTVVLGTLTTVVVLIAYTLVTLIEKQRVEKTLNEKQLAVEVSQTSQTKPSMNAR